MEHYRSLRSQPCAVTTTTIHTNIGKVNAKLTLAVLMECSMLYDNIVSYGRVYIIFHCSEWQLTPQKT
jgi:hypothetical protein